MPDDRSASAGVLLWVDLPTPGAATGGALVISGWAYRRGGARIAQVEARVGSHRAVIAQGVRRPDVALALDEPNADWSGFEGTLAVEESATERVDRLFVRASDEEGAFAEVEIPVRVVPTGLPLIEIENARWVVDRVEVEGWVVWPESVPPRRVALHVGETLLAESTPNLSRPDVARRFPALPHRSCRGFRLVGSLESHAHSATGRAHLRVVCTDARPLQLEQTATVVRESAPAPFRASQESVLQIESAIVLVRERMAREPVVLDWCAEPRPGSLVRAPTFLRPPAVDDPTLPYLDHSIDVVVTDNASEERITEARRVAAVATVEGTSLRWQPAAPRSPLLQEATIVIALRGRAVDAEACLARVKETLPTEFCGDVVLVDNHSPEETRAILRRWKESWAQVRVIRNEVEVGLARSLNRGAEAARGGILVFLDGSTLPQPGWLPPLLRLIRDDASVAAACGKLLNQDGTLRAAGSVLFADSSALGFGRFDKEPNRAIYSFVRDVDFGSSSILAVRRQAFHAAGGFDPWIGAIQDEGIDLCLRLRALGQRIRYQPETVAVYVDHSPARKSRVGAPSMREAAERRAGFRARWRQELATLSAPLEASDARALHALSAPAGARRALICGPGMPEFDRESGALRLFHLVELLQQTGWAVSYLAVKSADGERYLRILQQRGVATYVGPDSVRAGDEYVDDVGELIADGRFDLAIVAFWSVAETLLPRFRSSCPATCVVVDSVDLHYLREERAARSSHQPEPEANASLRRDRKRRELQTYAAADAVWTVSEREASLVADAISCIAPVDCVPDMEELMRSPVGFGERSGLLFIGNFHHPPNLEGLEFLCSEILPRLDPSLLAAHPLSVVGSGADEHVRVAVARVPHARIVGWVPSVVPYLERALVSLVPMLHGAGTKRKLVQALMLGTPSVATSIGVEGLDLEHGRHALIADSAGEFAAAIRELTGDPVLWDRLAVEGRAQVERFHSRDSVRQRLLAAVENAVKSKARRHSPQMANG